MTAPKLAECVQRTNEGSPAKWALTHPNRRLGSKWLCIVLLACVCGSHPQTQPPNGLSSPPRWGRFSFGCRRAELPARPDRASIAHARPHRCCNLEAPDECWHVFMVTCASARLRSALASRLTKTRGAGSAGSIPVAIRENARTAPPGPSTKPAPTSKQRGGCFCQTEPKLIFKHGAISGIGRRRNIGALIGTSACHQTGALVGWKRPFEDPIPLPRGRRLVTPEDAGNYITKFPKAEHEAQEWQVAMGMR